MRNSRVVHLRADLPNARFEQIGLGTERGRRDHLGCGRWGGGLGGVGVGLSGGVGWGRGGVGWGVWVGWGG